MKSKNKFFTFFVLSLLLFSSCRNNSDTTYLYDSNTLGGSGGTCTNCCNSCGNQNKLFCSSVLTVTDGEKPLSGIIVTVYHNGVDRYITDGNGEVQLVDLEEGGYVATIEVQNYETQEVYFAVEDGVCPEPNIIMSRLEAQDCTARFTVTYQGPAGAEELAGAFITIDDQTYGPSQADGKITVGPFTGTSHTYTITAVGYNSLVGNYDGSSCRNVTVTMTAPIIDVYVAGWYRQGDITIASYWKNGDKTDLDLGDHNSTARSIYVVGTDVYTAGFYYDGPYRRAAYWKNQDRTTIGPAGTNSNADSIYVVGSDVYVAGHYKNPFDVAAYWKNGDMTSLGPLAGVNSQAHSIYVIGNDVYVAGENSSKAVYWKNGYITTLSLSSSYAKAIYVVENDVYVAGGINFIAAYWKNGDKTDLVGGPGYYLTQSLSMYVVGTDVYVAGYYNDNLNRIASYWKNGNLTILGLTGSESSANSIYVAGGIDVYAAGIYNNINDSIATYWANGNRTDFGLEGSSPFAASIYLVVH